MEFLTYSAYALGIYVIGFGARVLFMKDANTIVHKNGLKHSRQ